MPSPHIAERSEIVSYRDVNFAKRPACGRAYADSDGELDFIAGSASSYA